MALSPGFSFDHSAKLPQVALYGHALGHLLLNREKEKMLAVKPGHR